MTTLSGRQRILYHHLCDLWEPVRWIDTATGKPRASSYRLAATAVPCYFEFTPNLDENTPAGTVRSDMIYTIDHVHLPADTRIGVHWRIVNRSLDKDGNKVPTYNGVWVCRGDPQEFSKQGRRNAGKKNIMASRDPKPSQQFVDHYAE